MTSALKSHFLLEHVRDYTPLIDAFQLLIGYTGDVIIYQVHEYHNVIAHFIVLQKIFTIQCAKYITNSSFGSTN